MNSIVLLIDTREQKNQHITDWLDKKKIRYRTKALKQGDYSFFVPANPELNIERDLYFDNDIVIERKNSADELATNFSRHRTRFEEEMSTFTGKKYLMIENCTYGDIVNGNYRSEYAAKSYAATLHSFNHRYDLEVTYMPDNSLSGMWIYNTFVYWLREMIR